MKYLVSTTQRCGSTWLTKLLEKALGARLARYIDGAALGFRLHGRTDEAAAGRLAETFLAKGDFQVFKTHDIPAKDFDRVCAAIPDLKLLTIRREFKDVLISRYFYYRYYWPTEPSLGQLGGMLAEFFDDIVDLPDEVAISCLINSRILAAWLSEWNAFEGEFKSANALRLTFDHMINGGGRGELSRFIRCTLPVLEPFRAIQERETERHGRAGSSRFFRQGSSDQWRNWIAPADVATLEKLSSRPLTA